MSIQFFQAVLLASAFSCVSAGGSFAADGRCDQVLSDTTRVELAPLREEYRRFTPYLASATDEGAWNSSREYANELFGHRWSDRRLEQAVASVDRAARLRELGHIARSQGTFNAVEVAELGLLGIEAVVYDHLDAKVDRDIAILDAVAKIIEKAAWDAIGVDLIRESDRVRAGVLVTLCEVARELGGPETSSVPLRLEVWLDRARNQGMLRAVNVNGAPMADVTISITCDFRGVGAAATEVVFVSTLATDAVISIPSRLLAGIPTTHAPTARTDAITVWVWGAEASSGRVTLDMPGYSRDERVPAPNALGAGDRPQVERYLLVDDASSQPRPDVLDKSGEPIAGWKRVVPQPARALETSEAASTLVMDFTCSSCKGTGELKEKVKIPGRGRPGIPLTENDYRIVTKPCDPCKKSLFSQDRAGETADNKFDRFVRKASGISQADERYDSVVEVLRGHMAGVLAINPSRSHERLTQRARKHFGNPRLSAGTPIWFAAQHSDIVRTIAGDEFRAARVLGRDGPLVALEAVTMDDVPSTAECISGGLFDGYIQTGQGPIPVLRGGFRIGQ